MKTYTFFALLFFLSSCQFNSRSKDVNSHISANDASVSVDSANIDMEYEYQYFKECNFAIKAPCVLKDVSQHTSNDSFINYGGVFNEDNPNKMAMYQVIVNRLPIGYKDLSKQELSKLVDNLLRKGMRGFSDCTPIQFSYNEYPGYVADCSINGYGQKGVIFWKDEYIICLTVITNDGLKEKFNKFTNSFKNLTDSLNSTSFDDKMDQSLPLLVKLYSNSYFHLRFPDSWEIVQENNQVTNKTNISVQIMEKRVNEYDFRPNINVIVSSRKWKEPTSYLAQQTINQNQQVLDGYHLIRKKDNIVLSKCNGSSIQYTFEVQGYTLHGIQYIIKKQDNTTFIVTGTADNTKEQQNIIDSIIKTITIK